MDVLGYLPERCGVNLLMQNSTQILSSILDLYRDKRSLFDAQRLRGTYACLTSSLLMTVRVGFTRRMAHLCVHILSHFSQHTNICERYV